MKNKISGKYKTAFVNKNTKQIKEKVKIPFCAETSPQLSFSY
jgi:hypothetical protein